MGHALSLLGEGVRRTRKRGTMTSSGEGWRDGKFGTGIDRENLLFDNR
ncbi:hypothetical protein DGo_PC0034 (plasmid) [Deinococcus gobiensis I-0]|uniref:Uncharacterized protein n=1 Tax=Deinococcus gobiensis (strain DSM 21396 / JCM 16679 / CGMCC 1.7299 / I-0) TaxID=745776 RepID=H8H2S9_DEIGI|nr:hypothetical protein DGo_PC0034 [Deinococcus gobiensis I-0]